MIEDFDQEQLHRRRSFLERRAEAHFNATSGLAWHQAAGATLLRDAAAVALIAGDTDSGRNLLRKSGGLFFRLGLVGGLQQLYIAGNLDDDEGEAVARIASFNEAFLRRELHQEQTKSDFRFDEESFRPPQLLRAYQGLAGRMPEDEEWSTLRQDVHQLLEVNATMPVGLTRTPLAIYLNLYDLLGKRGLQKVGLKSDRSRQVLGSIVQRREELLTAARRDSFHWKAMRRPAELIDFDLLALLLVAIRRGKRSKLVSSVFSKRDEVTALPYTVAKALKG
ncbi:hypothetical protein [Bradyrhizobium sp. USDA 3256]